MRLAQVKSNIVRRSFSHTLSSHLVLIEASTHLPHSHLSFFTLLLPPLFSSSAFDAIFRSIKSSKNEWYGGGWSRVMRGCCCYLPPLFSLSPNLPSSLSLSLALFVAIQMERTNAFFSCHRRELFLTSQNNFMRGTTQTMGVREKKWKGERVNRVQGWKLFNINCFFCGLKKRIREKWAFVLNF